MQIPFFAAAQREVSETRIEVVYLPALNRCTGRWSLLYRFRH